jgi:large subunit ribosomal protein L22
LTPPDQINPPPEGGWESLKVDELKAELEARGLPKSGKKEELVARLADDDVAQAGTTPAPAAEKEAAERAAPEASAETPEPQTPAPETPEPDSQEAQEAGEDAAAAADADEEAAEEAGTEDAEGKAKKPRRRRGSAETGATTRKTPSRRPDEAVTVRARARYVRTAPRKARLVMDHIRGKPVEQAQAILQHAPRAVSTDILKLLNSAVANAESAYELGADELTIHRAFVDEGPTIKRFRPRALGRATKINKRTSHMTIELTTDGNGR